MNIERLFDAATADSDSFCSTEIIVNVKAQGLAAYAMEISIDLLLLPVDILAINETCMNAEVFVNIQFSSVSSIARWWCGCLQSKLIRLHHYFVPNRIDSLA